MTEAYGIVGPYDALYVKAVRAAGGFPIAKLDPGALESARRQVAAAQPFLPPPMAALPAPKPREVEPMSVVSPLPPASSERRSGPALRPVTKRGGAVSADQVARALIGAARVCDLSPDLLLAPLDGVRTPRTINRARKLAALALVSALDLTVASAARLCGVAAAKQLAPSLTTNITDAEVLSLAATIAPW